MRVQFLLFVSLFGAAMAAPVPPTHNAPDSCCAPPCKREAGVDWKREADGKDWRREPGHGSQAWRREPGGGQAWRREPGGGGQTWRREPGGGGQTWRREPGSRDWRREPEPEAEPEPRFPAAW